MNKEDKDILSDIANAHVSDTPAPEDNDVLINRLFSAEGNAHTVDPAAVRATPKKKPAVGAPEKKKPQRSDARYTMTAAEIETLASAAEDAVADGRFGAALDSVFFTAGPARKALADKLNIRIPIGSADTDLPVIAVAALIEAYLQNEEINGADIVEKLRLIIESSEDENGARPSSEQVDLRIFECVLILCVQAEQSGKHADIKNRLYAAEDSFLRAFLAENIDGILLRHRHEARAFSASVHLQSKNVSEILESYMLASKNYAPFLRRFFNPSRPVLITSIVFGVLCLASVIAYFLTYGSIMSFVATDTFLIGLIIVLEVLFCVGMLGISWLVYVSDECRDELKK